MTSKNKFINDIKTSILSQIAKSLDIELYIGNYKDIEKEKLINIYNFDNTKQYLKNAKKINNIDFKIDFEKEIFNDFELSFHNVNIFFKDVVFKELVEFRNITLERLEFIDVIFKKNVGIKSVCINYLVLRPYEINANVVVNVDNYANDKGFIEDTGKHYIKNIEFEDPHVCNAKVFFIGTNFENGDFKNRLLDNVVFQNCDFENTYFLNSFLSKTTFLNCRFPTVINSFKFSHILSGSSLFVMIFFSSIAFLFYIDFDKGFSIIKEYAVLYIVYPLPLLILLGFTLFYFSNLLEEYLYKFLSLFGKSKMLLHHHIGIADEKKLNLSIQVKKVDLNKIITTRKNISSIYDDIKVNFKNKSDFQTAGDFHYAQSYNKTIVNDRIFDSFIIMYSYIFNGFGERYIRGFVAIIVILLLIGCFQDPNKDYVSTSATPVFLLKTGENNNKTSAINELSVTVFTKSSFLHIYENKYFTELNNSEKNIYAYDNRFDYNYSKQHIVRLNNDVLVRIYYATSHITYPFTQESKKWFQNVDKNAYLISIISSIILWLYLIGMITAIFNRIRR